MIRTISTKDKDFNAKFKKIINRSFEGKKEEIECRVKKIVEDVRKNGDRALFKYTLEFDRFDASKKGILLTKKEIQSFTKNADYEKVKILRKAYENILDFHFRQQENSWFWEKESGITIGQRVTPIEKVGVYVPGGKASYPSTVLMNCVPAIAAGVKEIHMAVPHPEGVINPYVLAAADICNVSAVYKVGGAQAISALAYGTKTVAKVDKIVGPGNIYVATAKKLVFGDVDIDMIAGPSEVLIIADKNANPAYIASDMLSQAEHDEMASAILITHDTQTAEKVKDELTKQLNKLKRKKIAGISLKNNGAIIITSDISESVEISNRFAPEHLELAVKNPFKILPIIKHAGAIFLGNDTPEALGDYFAGPNHTLPTGGTARFFSPLGVYDFVKRSSIISYSNDALLKVAKDVEEFACMEGLEAHGKAVRIRVKKNNKAAL